MKDCQYSNVQGNVMLASGLSHKQSAWIFDMEVFFSLDFIFVKVEGDQTDDKAFALLKWIIDLRKKYINAWSEF